MENLKYNSPLNKLHLNMLTFIKQKLSDSTKSLDFEKVAKRNAYPMSEQSSYLKKNQNGEFITGYNLPFGVDESNVLSDKKSPFYDLIIEKKNIEKALNVDLTPHKDNEFLLFLKIELTNKNNQDPKLDLSTPIGKLKYRAAIESGIVAPSREALNEIKYIGTDFYFSSPEKETSSKKNKEKLKNQIAAKLSNNENNKIWLLAVSNRLGLLSRAELTEDLLYTQISEVKNKAEKEEELKQILNVVNMNVEDLLLYFIVDKSFYFQLIKKSQEGAYTYKNIILGKTKEQVEDFLKQLINQDLFADLRTEIYEKMKIK